MVLSTALFGKPAFRNLICNGLVLAEDGKKMSKKLKNYPSPVEVINDYGAVSIRFSTFILIHSIFVPLFLPSTKWLLFSLKSLNYLFLAYFAGCVTIVPHKFSSCAC